MCLVCVDLIKQNMTVYEAERNLGELVRTAKTSAEFNHYWELMDSLREVDVNRLSQVLDQGSEGENQ